MNRFRTPVLVFICVIGATFAGSASSMRKHRLAMKMKDDVAIDEKPILFTHRSMAKKVLPKETSAPAEAPASKPKNDGSFKSPKKSLKKSKSVKKSLKKSNSPKKSCKESLKSMSSKSSKSSSSKSASDSSKSSKSSSSKSASDSSKSSKSSSSKSKSKSKSKERCSGTTVPAPTIAPTAEKCDSPNVRAQNITNVIEQISGGLPTPGSPQYLALQWLLNVDVQTNACDGIDAITQRYILAVFYYSTVGPQWTARTGWLTQSNECTWLGVTCTNGRVTQISLENNNLTGTLPPELGQLFSLNVLDLYTNQIEGSIPSQFGNLVNLTVLDCEINNFSGTFFFPEMQSMTNLISFRGSGNYFSGSIPTWIGQMTSLQQIWAIRNGLTGTIPTEITNLSLLRTFLVGRNSLSGQIPSNLGVMTSLKKIDFSENKMDGTIPSSFFQLTRLTSVQFNYNNFVGSIGTAWGSFPGLTEVFLQYNRFNGTISPEFASLSVLEKFTANNNLFVGQLPTFSSDKLFFVDASNNIMSGTIPPTLFSLPEMTRVYLSNNTIGGPLPSTFGDGIKMIDIFVDGNKLNGTIPGVATGAFVNISQVLLMSNYLTGNVPSSLCDIRFSKPIQFKSLQADCTPTSTKPAQTPCANGCCTACSIGPLIA